MIEKTSGKTKSYFEARHVATREGGVIAELSFYPEWMEGRG